AEERGVTRENIGKCGCLLVWGASGVIDTYRRLLRWQPIRNHRVAVVQAVHVGIEIAKSAAYHCLRERLPRKSEAWCQTLKLVRVLPGQRELCIFHRLRINLKVLAQAHLQGQFRKHPKRVLHVESIVRYRERKGRIPRRLAENIVLPQGKRLQI